MQANTVVEPEAVPANKDLRELAKIEGPCVTIYVGGHKAGSGSRPMKVRLPALLAEAERLLEQRGVLPTDRQSLMEPLRERAGEVDLGSGHAGGLALLRSPRDFEQAWLPWDVEDKVVLEGYPLLTPMSEGMKSHRRFLLLAVSKKHTRLLDCGTAGQQPLTLPAGVAQSLEEFEGFDKPDHNRGRTGAGASFTMDTSFEKQPNYLHDFCRALERGLQPLLEQRGLPLLIAGATAELSAYRAVNRYKLLVPGAIEGSPDGGWTDSELADKGRAIIKQWRPSETQHAVDLYLRAGPGKKATEMQEILQAAAAGRVLHLFLAGALTETGDVDKILGRVLPSGATRNEHDHLANAAAVETWRHDGQVWSLDEPLDGAAVAAVFRW